MDLFSEMELLIIVKLSMSSAMSQVCVCVPFTTWARAKQHKTHIHCCQSRAQASQRRARPREKNPLRTKRNGWRNSRDLLVWLIEVVRISTYLMPTIWHRLRAFRSSDGAYSGANCECKAITHLLFSPSRTFERRNTQPDRLHSALVLLYKWQWNIALAKHSQRNH